MNFLLQNPTRQYRQFVYGSCFACILIIILHNSLFYFLRSTSFDANHPHLLSESSQHLYEPKILCFIITHAANHYKRIIHIKSTWAKRCDKMLYFSSTFDPKIPTTLLHFENSTIQQKESRPFVWPKLMAAMNFLYENYYSTEYDWFLKADDDTYIIMDNVRKMLRSGVASKERAQYFAHRILYNFAEKSIISSGAGIIFNREALRRLVRDGFGNSSKINCNRQIGHPIVTDDVELTECLDALDIDHADDRDELQRGRMWNFPLEPRIDRGSTEPHFHYWLHENDTQQSSGLKNISPYSMSFHHVKPTQMYMYELLLYNLKV